MSELTPKQIRLLEKAKKFGTSKELATAESFMELEDKVDQIAESVDTKLSSLEESLKKKLESELVLEIDREELKGDIGEQGEKGDKGDRGERGEKGDKGDTTVVEKVIERTETIREIPLITKEVIEVAKTDKKTLKQISELKKTTKELKEFDIPTLQNRTQLLNQLVSGVRKDVDNINPVETQDLQAVTDLGSTTTNSITVNSVTETNQTLVRINNPDLTEEVSFNSKLLTLKQDMSIKRQELMSISYPHGTLVHNDKVYVSSFTGGAGKVIVYSEINDGFSSGAIIDLGTNSYVGYLNYSEEMGMIYLLSAGTGKLFKIDPITNVATDTGYTTGETNPNNAMVVKDYYAYIGGVGGKIYKVNLYSETLEDTLTLPSAGIPHSMQASSDGQYILGTQITTNTFFKIKISDDTITEISIPVNTPTDDFYVNGDFCYIAPEYTSSFIKLNWKLMTYETIDTTTRAYFVSGYGTKVYAGALSGYILEYDIPTGSSKTIPTSNIFLNEMVWYGDRCYMTDYKPSSYIYEVEFIDEPVVILEEKTDLTPYWKNNGTSTATGNWDIGTYVLKAGGFIFEKGTYDLTLATVSITGSNKTITFPNATGTVALTSNFSAYVPYTGATTNVDLGTRTITAQSFIGDGSQLSGIPKFTFFV
jgi:hypothetical protein